MIWEFHVRIFVETSGESETLSLSAPAVDNVCGKQTDSRAVIGINVGWSLARGICGRSLGDMGRIGSHAPPTHRVRNRFEVLF